MGGERGVKEGREVGCGRKEMSRRMNGGRNFVEKKGGY